MGKKAVPCADALMVGMKPLTFNQADDVLFFVPESVQLAHKIAQKLLEADLSVQAVNAVLHYAWYEVVCTGKLKDPPDRPFFGFTD